MIITKQNTFVEQTSKIVDFKIQKDEKRGGLE
jgi:hypothetical protein